MATKNKKSSITRGTPQSFKGRNVGSARTSKRSSAVSKTPRAGDWLVYTPDRTTLLDFGADLMKIRKRLKQKKVILGNCFLSRVPFEPDEPAELAGVETVVYSND